MVVIYKSRLKGDGPGNSLFGMLEAVRGEKFLVVCESICDQYRMKLPSNVDVKIISGIPFVKFILNCFFIYRLRLNLKVKGLISWTHTEKDRKRFYDLFKRFSSRKFLMFHQPISKIELHFESGS